MTKTGAVKRFNEIKKINGFNLSFFNMILILQEIEMINDYITIMSVDFFNNYN